MDINIIRNHIQDLSNNAVYSIQQYISLSSNYTNILVGLVYDTVHNFYQNTNLLLINTKNSASEHLILANYYVAFHFEKLIDALSQYNSSDSFLIITILVALAILILGISLSGLSKNVEKLDTENMHVDQDSLGVTDHEEEVDPNEHQMNDKTATSTQDKDGDDASEAGGETTSADEGESVSPENLKKAEKNYTEKRDSPQNVLRRSTRSNVVNDQSTIPTKLVEVPDEPAYQNLASEARGAKKLKVPTVQSRRLSTRARTATRHYSPAL